MGSSRVEDILQAGLDGTELPTAGSRVEILLKEWIEQGGNIDDILVAGSNITLTKNADGTITIDASGEVSSEDTVARAAIAAIKNGETLDSFGDVESALGDKADEDNVYKLALTDADLLPPNTDLDDVKTVGCYYVYLNGDVSSIINRPVTSANAFRLTVYYSAGKNRPCQTYRVYNSYDTYVRNSDSSGAWSSWKKVEADLSTKQDTISDLSTIRSGAALGATAVQPETGKGLSTNDYTTAEKTKLAGIAEGAEVNVQSNWAQTTTTADDYIKNKPTLGTAAAKNATDTYNATGTDVTTGKAVAAALATLPEPMVFIGSLGTGGTITTLPTASSSNKGYVYKVITAGTYASQSAKVGDTFISDGSAWVLIPSGDEPSGTVTNVAVANGGGLTVSGSPITTSGTITVGHSNSVTAKSSSSLKKFTYDANGHVTGSSELSTAESDALASGITSTDVAQITTNKNNILTLYEEGVINLVDTDDKTGSTWINIPIELPAGNYVLHFDTLSSAASGTTCQTVFFAADDSEASSYIYPTRGNNITFDVTVTKTTSYLRIYAGDSYAHSTNFTVEFTNLLVAKKESWEASSKVYQPYAMTNSELTAAIKALRAQLANQ